MLSWTVLLSSSLTLQEKWKINVFHTEVPQLRQLQSKQQLEDSLEYICGTLRYVLLHLVDPPSGS